ncbi:oxoacyl acyl carrier protein reductase; oxoacyl (acyl carrier protein) reductase [Trichuris trichiura]|uniref:Oxoacyl acyl carrier protein reductase oxoacyl ( acyl carrier protein) reductase n=1 Tax=Trichuris trichiura TaxID=36087 RepID=A0A077YWN5_TRITR|nr:oxoacyl acyl carrier protein reductase; oxoacyl (acyl carrier protein) reductase [Trichuris trichiura]
MQSLKEKVSIITVATFRFNCQFVNLTTLTGASSGIGRATAQHFAAFGAFLSLWGRDEQSLNDTKRMCIEKGLPESKVLCCKADVTKNSEVKTALDATLKRFGKLDILINSAGIILNGSLRNTPLEEFDRIMTVNVRSIIHLTQLCIPYLIQSKGTIVNVSSTASSCAYPGVAYYCISKAALDQFTKCLALDLAPEERAKELHPLGRVGEVDEVAAAISFLASSNSSFITGELLKVDAGRALVSPR